MDEPDEASPLFIVTHRSAWFRLKMKDKMKENEGQMKEIEGQMKDNEENEGK